MIQKIWRHWEFIHTDDVYGLGTEFDDEVCEGGAWRQGGDKVTGMKGAMEIRCG